MYKRPIYELVLKRVTAERKFIQVLCGPRQTGKTTLAKQISKNIEYPVHYATADEPAIKTSSWLNQQWETVKAKTGEKQKKALLIIDEIQKIPNWPETVKYLWDKDTADKAKMQLILLGSSNLLLQKGLTESLAGRFEVIHVTHWPYSEMHKAFGWNIDEYMFFGGYPGSVSLINENDRWKNYILDSLVEPTVAKDILMMSRIDKPALLKHLFELGCVYSGQILSYQKMLGQLQDAGNTTTLAHYLELLEYAGLLTGLHKFSGSRVMQRNSSPKLMVMNTALMTAHMDIAFKDAKKDTARWGRIVESAAGACLVNSVVGKNITLNYWRNGNYEVDFVLSRGSVVTAIEIKSGARRESLPGMEAFSKQYGTVKKLLVGPGGIPLEDFLLMPVEKLM